MLNSRQDLADYALRQLGAPVINIEVADDQLDDAIEDSILMFQEYHPDGIMRDYVKHQIQSTTIVVNDASLIQIGYSIFDATLQVYAVVKSIESNTLYVDQIVGPRKFEAGDIISYVGGTATVVTVTLGDIDNKWIPIGSEIVGVSKVLPWNPSYADGLFDITYQLRMNDLYNLASGNMNYFVTSMEYLSMLDFYLRKEKTFRFNRRMNRLYLDVNWSDLKPGDYIVVECQRILDDTTFYNVFNDPWLKKYATAKVKKQWGNNLSKHSNIALPGGVTLNGREILADATVEIKELEEELINNMAPLEFMLG